MISFGINFSIALLWLLLAEENSFSNFLIGFLIGYVLIYLFQAVLDSHTYIRRSMSFVLYCIRFAGLFISSNLNVLAIVLSPKKIRVHPVILNYDISDLSRFEILILSQSISLTPGSTSIDLDKDLTELKVHILDTGDPEETRKEIDEKLKRRILAFTR